MRRLSNPSQSTINQQPSTNPLHLRQRLNQGQAADAIFREELYRFSIPGIKSG